MARQFEGGGQAGRNWVLFLAIVLCVEFWVFVTGFVAENL
jgi:hypothetical protein